jgi:hypothetical protein
VLPYGCLAFLNNSDFLFVCKKYKACGLAKTVIKSPSDFTVLMTHLLTWGKTKPG